ncbi:phage protein Gp27 family protein, partial [Kingella kingae]|uniref:phage protein Gp27 family protein n=1 Tax=Kingella kingae TaxID=504 RepID=UPI00254A1E2D
MSPRSSMELLPENVRREFERRLIENGFANYTELAAWLNEQGFQISRSAVHRHGYKIQRRLQAIKESTEAAKLIVANADDENDSRSEALMALLQNQLFEALVDISEKDSEELAPEARFDLLSEGGKRIAGLISASTRLKEYQNKVKSRALAAADEVAKAVSYTHLRAHET